MQQEENGIFITQGSDTHARKKKNREKSSLLQTTRRRHDVKGKSIKANSRECQRVSLKQGSGNFLMPQKPKNKGKRVNLTILILKVSAKELCRCD